MLFNVKLGNFKKSDPVQVLPFVHRWYASFIFQPWVLRCMLAVIYWLALEPNTVKTNLYAMSGI